MKGVSKLLSDQDLSPIGFVEQEQVAMKKDQCVKEMVGEPKGRPYGLQCRYTVNGRKDEVKETFGLRVGNKKTVGCC